MACAALLAWSACSSVPEHAKPNFVVILADDLGYGDIAAYGSVRNATPHLDRMAGEGLCFSDFHSNGPTCRWIRVSTTFGGWRAAMAITTLTLTGLVARTGGTTKNSLLRRGMAPV